MAGMKPLPALVLLFFVLGLLGAGYRFIGIPYLPLVDYEGEAYPPNPYVSTAETAKDLWRLGTLERPYFRVLQGHLLELSRIHPEKTYRPDVFSETLDGRLMPKHPVLPSILAAPFYGLLGGAGIWLFEQLAVAAVLVCLYRISAGMSRPAEAFWVVVAAAVGTNLIWYYSYTFSYDLLGAALVLAGLMVLPLRPLAAGCLWGLSLHLRITHVLLFPFLLLACHPTRRGCGSAWLRCILGCVAVVLPVWVANHLVYGDALRGAYARAVNMRQGAILLDRDSMHFSPVYFREAVSRLFGGRESLFVTYPVLVLLPVALWGLLPGGGTRAKAAWLLAGGAFSILVHLGYSYWFGAGGDRFVLAAVLVMMAALAPALARLRLWVMRKSSHTQTD